MCIESSSESIINSPPEIIISVLHFRPFILEELLSDDVVSVVEFLKSFPNLVPGLTFIFSDFDKDCAAPSPVFILYVPPYIVKLCSDCIPSLPDVILYVPFSIIT